jgi:hypothetical protein
MISSLSRKGDFLGAKAEGAHKGIAAA